MVRQFLLTQPGVKLHETALNFGFCDEFHLSRSFRRRYGVSPDRYRKDPGAGKRGKSVENRPAGVDLPAVPL